MRRRAARRSAFLPLVLLLVCLFAVRTALATEQQPSAVNFLHAKYIKLEPKLHKNAFNMPLYVESREEDNRASVDVYGILSHPFELVSSSLASPANWCDIAFLHMNDKACTYARPNNAWLITLYSGRKYYQPPEETHQLNYTFRIKQQLHDYLSLQLHAAQGPLSTRDHRIEAELIPLDRDRTLLHLSYDFGFGSLGRMAMKTYFATLGRGKVGFSTSGADALGDPVLVGGIKGAIERNVVRYYCAILAFLDGLAVPREQQFEHRLNRWFELTDQHRRQLHELDKVQYLSNKRQEHKNQLMLQKKIAGQEGGRHP